MFPIAIDTETTGFEPETNGLVEVAAVYGPENFYHTLVHPGEHTMSFGAQATHHIRPDQLTDAPTPDDAMKLLGLCPPPSEAVLVFHNAEFDRKFLPMLADAPYICTYRCAMQLVPDAESHSNGALWYELGLHREMPPEAGSMPHRALFDALMTFDIVEWMLKQKTIEELIAMTTGPILLKKCRFGKHRDVLWEKIPKDYLQWCLRQDFDDDIKHTCRYWLNN